MLPLLSRILKRGVPKSFVNRSPQQFTSIFQTSSEALTPGRTLICKHGDIIKSSTISYCVMVDAIGQEERLVHHFTGIDIRGDRIEENIEGFIYDLCSFIKKNPLAPEITLSLSSSLEDLENSHITHASSSTYKIKNLEILQESLERIEKETGVKLTISHKHKPQIAGSIEVKRLSGKEISR